MPLSFHTDNMTLLLSACLQMDNLADAVGGNNRKGGKRWQLIFTSGAEYWDRQHALFLSQDCVKARLQHYGAHQRSIKQTKQSAEPWTIPR